MAYCPNCGAQASGRYCPNCGTPQAPAVAPPVTGAPQATPPPPPAPRPAIQGDVAIAITALLLNALIWPGLGSLIAGKNVGWAQGFLFLAAAILSFVLIGIPFAIGIWVWGVVTGVQILNEANRPAPAAA